jgi:thiol:disulfide interchange protein DsbA
MTVVVSGQKRLIYNRTFGSRFGNCVYQGQKALLRVAWGLLKVVILGQTKRSTDKELVMWSNFFKLFLKSVLCASFLAAAFPALAFTEGTDYVRLEKPIPNANKTLIKVFSYDCPFCYRYDKRVTGTVVQSLDGVVKFEPYHLETKAKYGAQASRLFAVLILKDQASGTSLIDDKSLFNKAKMAYYAAYHDKNERWDGGEDAFLKTGLDAVGMSQAEYDAAAKDPKVEEMLQRWTAAHDAAKIQGVPAYIVNGKFLIQTKSIRSESGLANLIKELERK